MTPIVAAYSSIHHLRAMSSLCCNLCRLIKVRCHRWAAACLSVCVTSVGVCCQCYVAACVAACVTLGAERIEGENEIRQKEQASGRQKERETQRKKERHRERKSERTSQRHRYISIHTCAHAINVVLQCVSPRWGSDFGRHPSRPN